MPIPKKAKSGAGEAPSVGKCRPFAKLPIEIRELLPTISGGRLKILIAYLLRANQDGEAWPGLDTLSRDTGLSRWRASTLRNELKDAGFLVPAGTRGRGGKFSCPRFRVSIPPNHRTAKMPHGGKATRRVSKSPYGENANHRTAKMQREVDSLELAPKEELPSGSSKALPSANQFANRKISNGDPDPRFASFKDYYFSEFQNRFRDVKPAFDASDGSAIKRLLKQQRDAATETLISWLRNAFESDDVPPLRPGFRMREFCAHATKYTTGPILRTGSCRTTSDWDNSQQGKFEKIVQ